MDVFTAVPKAPSRAGGTFATVLNRRLRRR
jgi:hypothetical protein